jgi:hypothetical protein
MDIPELMDGVKVDVHVRYACPHHGNINDGAAPLLLPLLLMAVM